MPTSKTSARSFKRVNTSDLILKVRWRISSALSNHPLYHVKKVTAYPTFTITFYYSFFPCSYYTIIILRTPLWAFHSLFVIPCDYSCLLFYLRRYHVGLLSVVISEMTTERESCIFFYYDITLFITLCRLYYNRYLQ